MRHPITIIGTSSPHSPRKSPGYPPNTSTGIPASLKMLAIGSPPVGSPSGLENACLSQSRLVPLFEPGERGNSCTFNPIFCKTIASKCANHMGSVSVSDAMRISDIWPLSFSNISNCSLLMERVRNCFSSSTRARSAFAARSFASPDWRIAPESLSADRLFIWVLYVRTNILGSNSPSTPNATSTSAITDPHRSRHESKGGCSIAMNTSITRPMKTRPVLPIAKCSQNFCARSNSGSVAFMTPFLRSGRGNDNLRLFWIVVIAAITVIVLAALAVLLV